MKERKIWGSLLKNPQDAHHLFDARCSPPIWRKMPMPTFLTQNARLCYSALVSHLFSHGTKTHFFCLQECDFFVAKNYRFSIKSFDKPSSSYLSITPLRWAETMFFAVFFGGAGGEMLRKQRIINVQIIAVITHKQNYLPLQKFLQSCV